MNLERAFAAFDEYNSADPNKESWRGKVYAKEVLYGQRMSERLEKYAPNAPEAVKLAARCQHIGRWEIKRDAYPMDRAGYLKWRSQLAIHHADIAGQILSKLAFDTEIIDEVRFLLQKKQLKQNAQTQLLEDVIFLVFVEFYLEDFAAKHEDEKVVDIIRKTFRKISAKAIEESGSIHLSERIGKLISIAAI